MPIYDFVCDKCTQRYEITFRMSDDAGRSGATCVNCGEKLKRVFGAPAVIVKGTINQVLSNLASNQAIIERDGQPIRLNFIDHGPRSELCPGSVGNSVPGARMDEKSGRMVVDVVSNVKDPLGKMERMKRSGDMDVKKSVHKVNHPVKMRKR